MKRHKHFLSSLKYFLMHVHQIVFKYFKCLGLKISIRGKISVGGNSKKKRYNLALGTNSLGKKKLKISYANGLIKTTTGVLGLNILLFY
jgi:ribosomal protein S3